MTIGKSVLKHKPQYRGKSTATIAQMRKNIIKTLIYVHALGGDSSRRPSNLKAPSIASYEKSKGYFVKVRFFDIQYQAKEAKKVMRFLYDSGIDFKTESKSDRGETWRRLLKTKEPAEPSELHITSMSVNFFLTYSQIDGIGELL